MERPNINKAVPDEKIRAPKKVTFVIPEEKEMKSEHKEMFFEGRRKKKKRIKTYKILRLLKLGELEVLGSYLRNIDTEELNRFFSSEEAHLIISYLLEIESNSKFRFMAKHVPINCLKNAISWNNYYMLVDFLELNSIAERYRQDTSRLRKRRVNKFKFLLEIDSNIAVFMRKAEEMGEGYITREAMEDFEKALNSEALNKISALSS